MIYITKPDDFNPRFEIVSCFVEHNNEFLLLLRQDHKLEPNTWGVPAGKKDKNETQDEALIREVEEETQINLKNHKLTFFKTVYVRYENRYDFIYHIYHTNLETKPKITINPNEHKKFQWISPKESLNINLIPDVDACIKLFYKI